MKLNVTYHRASSDEELYEILALQKINLPRSISDSEKDSEGFVTVDHTFSVLKAMNEVCPHIIAKCNNKVVGYALCMHPDFADDVDVLKSMFHKIDAVLPNESYIAMGQICISKDYRKQGVFRGLYTAMRRELKESFNKIVTEVDIKNTRSMQAHYAVGFRDVLAYHSDGHDWMLISLDI